jgi:hypothetical protein
LFRAKLNFSFIHIPESRFSFSTPVSPATKEVVKEKPKTSYPAKEHIKQRSSALNRTFTVNLITFFTKIRKYGLRVFLLQNLNRLQTIQESGVLKKQKLDKQLKMLYYCNIKIILKIY